MFTVYATYRNADMTEGKGPMVMDKIFLDERDAHDYINQQDGVMGRKPEHGWQNSNSGDWQVKPIQIFEHLLDSEEYVRQQNIKAAYQKLTPAEKAAIEWHIRQALMPDQKSS